MNRIFFIVIQFLIYNSVLGQKESIDVKYIDCFKANNGFLVISEIKTGKYLSTSLIDPDTIKKIVMRQISNNGIELNNKEIAFNSRKKIVGCVQNNHNLILVSTVTQNFGNGVEHFSFLDFFNEKLDLVNSIKLDNFKINNINKKEATIILSGYKANPEVQDITTDARFIITTCFYDIKTNILLFNSSDVNKKLYYNKILLSNKNYNLFFGLGFRLDNSNKIINNVTRESIFFEIIESDKKNKIITEKELSKINLNFSNLNLIDNDLFFIQKIKIKNDFDFDYKLLSINILSNRIDTNYNFKFKPSFVKSISKENLLLISVDSIYIYNIPDRKIISKNFNKELNEEQNSDKFYFIEGKYIFIFAEKNIKNFRIFKIKI